MFRGYFNNRACQLNSIIDDFLNTTYGSLTCMLLYCPTHLWFLYLILIIRNTVAVMIPIIANTTKVKYSPKLTWEFSKTSKVLSFGGPRPSFHCIGVSELKSKDSVWPLYSPTFTSAAPVEIEWTHYPEYSSPMQNKSTNFCILTLELFEQNIGFSLIIVESYWTLKSNFKVDIIK